MCILMFWSLYEEVFYCFYNNSSPPPKPCWLYYLTNFKSLWGVTTLRAYSTIIFVIEPTKRCIFPWEKNGDNATTTFWDTIYTTFKKSSLFLLSHFIWVQAFNQVYWWNYKRKIGFGRKRLQERYIHKIKKIRSYCKAICSFLKCTIGNFVIPFILDFPSWQLDSLTNLPFS